MDKEMLLQVGVISSAHGIRGEVNVFPTTDDINRFKKLRSVYIEKKDGISLIKIKSVKFFKQTVILQFESVDDRNEAELLRKCPLYVDREHAVKLEKDEYFVADLVGLSVYDEAGDLIGKLTEVITTGANDVYEIKFDKDFMYNGEFPKEDKLYIPAIKECVLSVDMDEHRMNIHIMDGLI